MDEFAHKPTSPVATTADRPLVETRLVAWYFLAALTFLFISMLGGILMALQLVSWNPLHGIGTVLARPLADGPYKRRCLRIFGQRLFGLFALGRAAIDAKAGAQQVAFVFHLLCLANRGARDSGRHSGRICARRRMGRNARVHRSFGAGRPAAGGDQLHGTDRAHQGTAVRDAVVFHGDVCVDVSDLCDGQLHSAVLSSPAPQHGAVGRAVHSRPGGSVRHAAWAGG